MGNRYGYDRVSTAADKGDETPVPTETHNDHFWDHQWHWRVAGVSATGHRVENGDQGCRVVFELPAIAAGYVPVCWVALSRIGGLVE